ncbi:MAG TPA: GDP-mannose 4,6-dehydratase [Acetobacteraceae bacterium]|nr:GDP-mannose 4,6-dehydratase [Acetobacteraceae bacterium]
MKTRVLVTGGAGFIGSHLVDVLLADGESVNVLDDFSTGAMENLADAEATGRLRLLRGSILDSQAVAAAMAGCDRVFHLAVQCVRRSLGNPQESHDVNATGTLNVLEAARARCIRRFVYCSSSEVYGNTSDTLLREGTTQCRPVTVYGAAKLAGELYTEAYRQTYGLDTVIVRPFNAYGPRAPQQGTRAEVIPRFLIRAMNGLPPVIFGDGSNGRDFTYVTELAQGLALAGGAASCSGTAVNIAYGRMVTVREVAQTVLRAVGRNDLSVTLHAARPGDVHRLHADNSRAAELLGFRPRVAFEDGVQRYADWFRARYPDPAALLEENVENWTMPAEVTAS